MEKDDHPLTPDELDELILKTGTLAEKKRILEERARPKKIGVGNKYGRQ